jgi:hypothetical protein
MRILVRRLGALGDVVLADLPSVQGSEVDG